MRLPSWLQPAEAKQSATKPEPEPTVEQRPVAPVAPTPASTSPPADSGEKLDRSRDRSLYQAFLSSLYYGVVIVDEKGYIIASNVRAEQFFGYPAEDFWNLPCGDLITAFNPMVLAKIRNHVSSGRFTVINANCQRKDGSVFPAEIAISNIHYLNPDDLLMTIRNLERQKKADDRREIELDAVRHTCLGLMVCNRDGLIEYVNSACVRLLQFENEHQVVRRFLGDFCESLKATEQILRAPSEVSNWYGRATFRTGRDHSLEFTITSAMSPRRKDAADRVVISLMPEVKTL